jgi:hypothetical protein
MLTMCRKSEINHNDVEIKEQKSTHNTPSLVFVIGKTRDVLLYLL